MMKQGIGPHEGKELSLMLAGQKRVALFFDFIPIGFLPYLDNQTFHLKVSFYECDEFAHPSFIIYVPEYVAWAEQLMRLRTPELLKLDETHRQIGRILGYEAWQIEAFIHQHRSS